MKTYKSQPNFQPFTQRHLSPNQQNQHQFYNKKTYLNDQFSTPKVFNKKHVTKNYFNQKKAKCKIQHFQANQYTETFSKRKQSSSDGFKTIHHIKQPYYPSYLHHTPNDYQTVIEINKKKYHFHSPQPYRHHLKSKENTTEHLEQYSINNFHVSPQTTKRSPKIKSPILSQKSKEYKQSTNSKNNHPIKNYLNINNFHHQYCQIKSPEEINTQQFQNLSQLALNCYHLKSLSSRQIDYEQQKPSLLESYHKEKQIEKINRKLLKENFQLCQQLERQHQESVKMNQKLQNLKTAKKKYLVQEELTLYKKLKELEEQQKVQNDQILSPVKPQQISNSNEASFNSGSLSSYLPDPSQKLHQQITKLQSEFQQTLKSSFRKTPQQKILIRQKLAQITDDIRSLRLRIANKQSLHLKV